MIVTSMDMVIYNVMNPRGMTADHAVPKFIDSVSEDCRQYLDKIQELYDAPFIRELGIEVGSVSSDEISLYLDIQPKHINSRGFVHGGVIYTLMDHSLAFASNLCGEAVGQSSNVIYHRPAKEGRLISKLTVINRSRTLLIYDVKVYCNDKLIASSTMTAFRLSDDR